MNLSALNFLKCKGTDDLSDADYIGGSGEFEPYFADSAEIHFQFTVEIKCAGCFNGENRDL